MGPLGVKSVERNTIRYKLCVSFNLFILGILLLACCAFAGCGDCDDNNPCTRDICVNATRCEHTPQSCDKSDSAPAPAPKIESNANEQTIPASIPASQDKPATTDAAQENPAITNAAKENPEPPAAAQDSPATIPTAQDKTENIDTARDVPATTEAAQEKPEPSAAAQDSLATIATTVENMPSDIPAPDNPADEVNDHSQQLIPEPFATSGSDANGSVVCDDNNPCTSDSPGESGCIYSAISCDDGNDRTVDTCSPSGCVNTPICIECGNSIIVPSSGPAQTSYEPNKTAHENGTNIVISEDIGYIGVPDTNNSAEGLENITEDNTLADSSIHDCDDGNPCTIDSFNGKECVHTLTYCDDGNACTMDICDNGKCTHTPKNCDDGDPCTVDHCDSVSGCYHSSVVCYNGKTCIDGVCKYPYYDYVAPYVAPTAATSSPQSYTIPAGTAVTLPWSQSMTALGALQVNNGLAYPNTSPLRFARLLGYETQAAPTVQIGMIQSTTEEAEMIGLTWKDASFSMTLVQPNGTALPAVGDGQNVIHVAGTNYNYYFLKNAAKGSWYIEIKPIDPSSNGAAYSLITGQVKGTLPANQA